MTQCFFSHDAKQSGKRKIPMVLWQSTATGKHLIVCFCTSAASVVERLAIQNYRKQNYYSVSGMWRPSIIVVAKLREMTARESEKIHLGAIDFFDSIFGPSKNTESAVLVRKRQSIQNDPFSSFTNDSWWSCIADHRHDLQWLKYIYKTNCGTNHLAF